MRPQLPDGDPQIVVKAARGWAQFSSGQMHYSLVGRDVEHEIVPFMRYAGQGMTVWGPLAGGFLSGKYTRENLNDSENRLAGFDFLPFDADVADLDAITAPAPIYPNWFNANLIDAQHNAAIEVT